MSAPVADPISAHVAALARTVRGPARARHSVLREVRDGLDDAAGAYVRGGADPRRAAELAVRDFGPVSELAPLYQEELAAGAGRRTALLLVAGIPTVRLAWSLLAGGHPDDPPASSAVEVLSAVQDVVVALATATARLLIVLGSRRAAPARAVAAAAAVTVFVAVAVIGGVGVAMNVAQSGQVWLRLTALPAGPLVYLGSVLMVVLLNRSAAVTLCALRPRAG